jgi:hypothetical protein
MHYQVFEKHKFNLHSPSNPESILDLYLIGRPFMLKVGIARYNGLRIATWLCRGWRLLDCVTMPYHKALAIEQLWLHHIYTIKIGGRSIFNNFDGYTECWLYDNLSIDNLKYVINIANTVKYNNNLAKKRVTTKRYYKKEQPVVNFDDDWE